MKFHGVEGKWFSPVLLNWRFLLNFVLKPLRLDKKFFIFSIFKDAYLERIYGKRKTNAIGADAWFDIRDQTIMHLLQKMAGFSHKFYFMLCLNCYGHSYSPKMSTISWNTSFRSLVPSTVFKTPCLV
mgnify:CR=1 FL=1